MHLFTSMSEKKNKIKTNEINSFWTHLEVRTVHGPAAELQNNPNNGRVYEILEIDKNQLTEFMKCLQCKL